MGENCYLFLDIDGVLHPQPSASFRGKVILSPNKVTFSVEGLAAISSIVEACNPRIVLSSSWRRVQDRVDDITCAFIRYGRANGGPLSEYRDLYALTGESEVDSRKWEIAQWIQAERKRGEDVSRFVILDDDVSVMKDVDEIANRISMKTREKFGWDSFIVPKDKEYSELIEGHVVLTQRKRGLTKEHGEKAIEILKQTQGCNSMAV